MANWSDLKASVSQVIRTNGNQEITGQILQNVLNNIISNLGANAQFVGMANPDTNPGTPDGNVFYLAYKEGTYSNFNAITLDGNKAKILLFKNGAWSALDTGLTTTEKTLSLENNAILSLVEKYGGFGVSPEAFHVEGGGVKNEDGSYTFTNSANQNKVVASDTNIRVTGDYILIALVSKIETENGRGFRYYFYNKPIADYSTETGIMFGKLNLSDVPCMFQIMADSEDISSGTELGTIKFEKMYLVKYSDELWNILKKKKEGEYYDLVYSLKALYAETYDEQDKVKRVISPLNSEPYHDYSGENKTGDYSIKSAGLNGIVFRVKEGEYTSIDTFTTKVVFSVTKKTGLTAFRGYVGTDIVKVINAEGITLGQEYSMYFTGYPGSDGSPNGKIASQFRVLTEGSTVDVEYNIKYIVVYKGLIPENIITEYTEQGVYDISNVDYSRLAYNVINGIKQDITKNFNLVDNLGKGEDISYDSNTKEFLFTGSGTSNNRIQDRSNKGIESGKDYIYLAAIPNFEVLNEKSPYLRVYHYANNFYNITRAGLHVAKFTSNNSQQLIQYLPSQEVMDSIEELKGVQYLKFTMLYAGVIEYSDEIFNYLIKISRNVNNNNLNFCSPIITFDSLSISNFFGDASLKIFKDRSPFIARDKEVLVTYWTSVAAGGSMSITNTNDKDAYDICTVVMPSSYTTSGDQHRNYFGFKIDNSYVDSGITDFVIVFKGSIKGKNIKNVYLGNVSTTLLTQDVEDDVEIEVQGMLTLNSPQGNSIYNGVFFYPKTDLETEYVETRMTTKTRCFFVCQYVEGYSIDDYIKIYENGNINYYPLVLNPDAASKEDLNRAIAEVEQKFSAGVKDAYDADYNTDVNMLINYGQSLSVGGSLDSSAADFHKMLTFKGGGNEWRENVDIDDPISVENYYGTDLLIFEETSVTVGAPVGCNALAWMERLINENNVDLDTFEYQFLLSTPGYSGAPIEFFIKDTTYYKRLLFSVTKGKQLSNKMGKTFCVPALFWVQGEGNTQVNPDNPDQLEQDYYNKLKQMFIDLNTDIKAITGQENDVAFITYQQSPVLDIVWNDTNYKYSGPSWAHLRAALELENVYLGGAMYQYDYGTDLWHPTDRNVVGLQAGIVAKRIINDKAPYPVFYPKKHSIEKDELNGRWILSIEYDVPVPPMRFDISGDIYHNLNGKQENYGFKLTNALGTNIIYSEPTISRGNVLKIICTENPVGAILSYATTGHFGGGNLCDSQNISITVSNKSYIIDNFAPAFKSYEITE